MTEEIMDLIDCPAIEYIAVGNQYFCKVNSCDCTKISTCGYKRLEQENKELEIKLSSTKCYLCGEGFLTPEGAELYEEKNNYRSALEEIREILLLPDMPEVKEQTIITSTMLDEIVRANRENKLQKIKQAIYEVLNLS